MPEQACAAFVRVISLLLYYFRHGWHGCPQDVKSVAAGVETSAAVTRDGVLLVWGCNSRGRLGLPQSDPAAPTPRVLSTLSALGVTQVWRFGLRV